MKSGLEGRNNLAELLVGDLLKDVSMKSGLEGRNNDVVQYLRIKLHLSQ